MAKGGQRGPKGAKGGYLLGRDVEGNCSQIHLHEGIGARQDKEDACYKGGKQMIFGCFALRGRQRSKVGMSTWPLGLPVCDAAQPEDDSALVLLHDLQEQNTGVRLTGGSGRVVLLLQEERPLSSSLTLTHNQTVMGKRTMTKMVDRMTKIQPTHPRDPVRSAGWREKGNDETKGRM